MVVHPIPPVFDRNSRILILGSFPSVKSREACFFYAHPQNRFWRVLGALTKRPVPQTVPQKRELLLSEGIALWDVIASCEIAGSLDSSIKNVIPNDMSKILDTADIKCVFANGKKAAQLYQKLIWPVTKRKAVCLPSTSPANAACSLEMLIRSWSVILRFL